MAKKWYNNGIEEKLFVVGQQPEGWAEGLTKETKLKRREKCEQTCMLKYGVKNVFQLDSVKEKCNTDEVIEKANLSLEIDDEFMEAVEKYYETGEVVTLHEKRDYSGHIVEYDVVPIEIFKLLVDNSYDWGDPACLFTNRFRNYNIMEFDDDYQIETSNP